MKAQLVLASDKRLLQLTAESDADKIIFGGLTEVRPRDHDSTVLVMVPVRLRFSGHYSNAKIESIDIDFVAANKHCRSEDE